jgi:hypothetical protein
MTSSAAPIGKLMSDQTYNDQVTDRVSVPPRQTGYASMPERKTAAERSS